LDGQRQWAGEDDVLGLLKELHPVWDEAWTHWKVRCLVSDEAWTHSKASHPVSDEAWTHSKASHPVWDEAWNPPSHSFSWMESYWQSYWVSAIRFLKGTERVWRTAFR
jgi:hypothetical protein